MSKVSIVIKGMNNVENINNISELNQNPIIFSNVI